MPDICWLTAGFLDYLALVQAASMFLVLTEKERLEKYRQCRRERMILRVSEVQLAHLLSLVATRLERKRTLGARDPYYLATVQCPRCSVWMLSGGRNYRQGRHNTETCARVLSLYDLSSHAVWKKRVRESREWPYYGPKLCTLQTARGLGSKMCSLCHEYHFLFYSDFKRHFLLCRGQGCKNCGLFTMDCADDQTTALTLFNEHRTKCNMAVNGGAAGVKRTCLHCYAHVYDFPTGAFKRHQSSCGCEMVRCRGCKCRLQRRQVEGHECDKPFL